MHKNFRYKFLIIIICIVSFGFNKSKIESGNVMLNNYIKDSVNDLKYTDGPYITWKRKKIKVAYFYHQEKKDKVKVIKEKYKVDSNNFVFNGFAFDSNTYELSKYNKISKDNWQNINNVFVIGDVHGEYFEMIKLLRFNNIIDENLNWIWEQGHLVLTGDVFDKGDYVTECLWLIYKLEKQAEKAGGKVHFILGTHEMYALRYFNGYLTDKYNALYTKRNIEYSNFYSKKTLLGQWLRTKNTMLIINDNLFLHGGISHDLFHYRLQVHEVNNYVRKFLDRPYNFERNEIVQTIIGDKGPYWYRGFNEGEKDYETINEFFIDQILAFYKVSHIVFGHTEMDSIKATFNGKLINIDVPLDDIEIESQSLLIKGNSYYIAFTNRKPTLLKL